MLFAVQQLDVWGLLGLTKSLWRTHCRVQAAVQNLPLPPTTSSQEGVEPFGADCWEMARVLAGRPKAGVELTEDYNPLEAGLYHACSVTKGCSIGQETINKVRQRVAGDVCGCQTASPVYSTTCRTVLNVRALESASAGAGTCVHEVSMSSSPDISCLAGAQPARLEQQLWGRCTRLNPLPSCSSAPPLHSTLPQVHNLNAVKQQLWGLDMEAPCLVGDAVEAPDGTKLGKVTSYIDTPSGASLDARSLCCAAWRDVQLGAGPNGIKL